MGLSPVAHIGREIRLVFESPKTFQTEYARNLSKAGAFVPTDEDFELLEPVIVHLDALFAGERVTLAAEIVHSQPRSGVSVQFIDPVSELRLRLDPILAKAEALWPSDDDDIDVPQGASVDALEPLPELGFEELEFHDAPATDSNVAESDDDATLEQLPDDPTQRVHRPRAERWRARVPVRVRGPEGVTLQARSRDLSLSGILLSLGSTTLPVGAAVELTIVHPTSGESFDVSARVVRPVEGEGTAVAIAFRFEAAERSAALERFVEGVRLAHQERQSAGIYDRLSEGGVAETLRVLAAAMPRGTLTVIQGVEEGVIVFDARRILAVDLGSVIGLKALARLLAWREGSLEFYAQVDAALYRNPPLDVEAAILDAQRLLEASCAAGRSALPLWTRFDFDRERIDWLGRALTAIETDVVARAGAGSTVRGLLDGIPESDAAIFETLLGLIGDGVLTAVPRRP